LGLIVLDPGMLTTVQDQGRLGYQSLGFTVSGAMDRRAARIANLLVGNTEREALLECSLVGATLEFTSDCVIAITGAKFQPELNGEPIDRYRAIEVKPRDVLSCGSFEIGMFGYIAFSGGLDLPEVMGSRSTTVKTGIGGLHGRALKKGDSIAFMDVYRGQRELIARHLPVENPSEDETVKIRVVSGPQADDFTKEGISTFYNVAYEITDEVNRMGYRLDGPAVEHKTGADIISDGIPLGAIQIVADGTPIVMLADRQTTGGYTKIATILSVDIPKFVQLAPGKIVKFEAVDVDTANQIYTNEENEFSEIEKTLYSQSRQSGGIRYTAERIEKLLF